jgi:hypothetical protein
MTAKTKARVLACGDSTINWQSNYSRQIAVDLAIKLFAQTEFSKLLTNISNPNNVQDVPFYNIVEDINAYLTTGKFPAFEAFKKNQKKEA